MAEGDSNTLPSRSMKHNILSMAALMAKMPANVLNTPFSGQLALMELARVLQALRGVGVELRWFDGEGFQPLESTASSTEAMRLTLNDRAFTLRRVQFHHAATAVFDHILLFVAPPEGAGNDRLLMIAPDESPLTDAEGERLVRSHLSRIAAGQAAVGDFYQELEAVASLLLQGDPMGALSGGP